MQPYYTPEMPNTPGIYLITCTVTAKIYIGSALNLRERRKEHFGSLQRNEHHNSKLQRAFNKYGPDSFTFEVLEFVLVPEMLTAREQYWFEQMKPFGNKGFNIHVIAGSSLGRVVSPETRKKIGDTQRGKPSKRINYKRSPETIEKHRQSLTNYKHTEEAKRNMAKAQEGRVHSQASRDKRSLSLMGHAPTNARTFIVTSPDGVEYVVTNGLPAFCREHNLCSSTLGEVARGHRRQHKGWTARYPEQEENAG